MRIADRHTIEMPGWCLMDRLNLGVRANLGL